MTDALYDDLRHAVRAVRLQLDPLPDDSASLGVAWHQWARALLAGLYSRKTTMRALEAARPEALLAGAINAMAVLSRVAASAAATAVLNAIDGNDARAQEVARETRVIADLLASQLKARSSSSPIAAFSTVRDLYGEPHLVCCPYCARQFDLFAAAWCTHQEAEASKVCPQCRRCMCEHPAYAEPHFWKDAPPAFQRHGFQRLFLYYL